MKPLAREWVRNAENERFGKALDAITDYAVDFRYPGHAATLRQAREAMRHCRLTRAQVRRSLGLKA